MSGVLNALTLRAYLHSSYEPFSPVIGRAMTLSPMNTRRERIKQVRMRVVAVGVALFLAALGGVPAGGKQPATKVAHAATTTGSAAAATSTQTYDDGSSSY